MARRKPARRPSRRPAKRAKRPAKPRAKGPTTPRAKRTGPRAARRPAPHARRPARRATPRPPPRDAAPAPAQSVTPPGAYVHIELYSEDPASTERFYHEVFGWRFRTMEYGPGMKYTGYEAAARPHGGLQPREGMPAHLPGTLAYILVDSVDAAQRRIERAGGKVLHPRYEVPNVGYMAIFEAPGGIVQAVWESHPSFQARM